MTIPHLHHSSTRAIFFWIGIFATVCYRAIIFFTDTSSVLLRSAWYLGTIGFILYFAHRYQVASRRARVIQDFRLMDAVTNVSGVSDDQRAGLQYVLQTLQSSREKWNYYVIFASSAIALIAGLWMDLR